MERRNNKLDYPTVSKEVIERRSKTNETMRNRKNVSEKNRNESVSSNYLGLQSEKDVEDGVIEPEKSLLRKEIKKVQAPKLNVNVQEDGFFEESKLELAEKPMITFNHVCTVTESEQISFEAIKNSSRSPSPLLGVPSFKIGSKQTVRPPL